MVWVLTGRLDTQEADEGGGLAAEGHMTWWRPGFQSGEQKQTVGENAAVIDFALVYPPLITKLLCPFPFFSRDAF